jgi:hypothetical protein
LKYSLGAPVDIETEVCSPHYKGKFINFNVF